MHNYKNCDKYENINCPKFLVSNNEKNNLYKFIDNNVFIFTMFGCWGTYCRSEEDKLNIPKINIENLFGETISYEEDDDRYSSLQAYELLKEYCNNIDTNLIILAGDNVYTDYNLVEKMGVIRKKFDMFMNEKGISIEDIKDIDKEKIEKILKIFKKRYIADIIYDIEKQIKEGFEDCFGKIDSDFLIGIGNHDIETCNVINYQLNYSDTNTKWNLPGLSYNYIYELNDGTKINFIFIDTNLYSGKYFCDAKGDEDVSNIIDKQHEWIEKVLYMNKESWNIIIGHEPVITNRHKNKDKSKEIKYAIISKLYDFIKKNNKYIDMYMCADEHNQQFINMKNNYIDIPIIISGTGGAILDKKIYISKEKDIGETVYNFSSVGFVSNIVDKDKIILSFVNRDDDNLDKNYYIKWKR